MKGRVAAYKPASFVEFDGREVEVDVISVRRVGDVLMAMVYAVEGKPFVSEAGLPTAIADFEISLVKVRRVEIYLHSIGYTQNDPSLLPA